MEVSVGNFLWKNRWIELYETHILPSYIIINGLAFIIMYENNSLLMEFSSSPFIVKTTNYIVEKMVENSLNVYNTQNHRSNMQNVQDVQCIGNVETVVFTQKQAKDVNDFKNLLKNGKPEFAFEGSLLEGVSFLRGVSQIVEAINH